MDEIETPDVTKMWRKTANGRLFFELAGLAFALEKGASPEEFARNLWGEGAVKWMGKTTPDASEYLGKEAAAFREFYPGVEFEILKSDGDNAELVFTHGCLGSGPNNRWEIAKRFGLTKTSICHYCQEAFQVWAKQLGLSTNIGTKEDLKCHLTATKLQETIPVPTTKAKGSIFKRIFQKQSTGENT